MKPTDTITERLWSIIDPVCTSAGYELIDTAFTQSSNGWALRVFIDHPPTVRSIVESAGGEDMANMPAVTAEGSSISLEDCTRMSRELGALLDVENPIDRPYSLEVSSPGLDRPLRQKTHFQRYLGHEARVTLKNGIDGRRNFKGTLISLVESNDEKPPEQLEHGERSHGVQTLLVMSVNGARFSLPFDDIDNARLVPDWNSLFQRGGQQR